MRPAIIPKKYSNFFMKMWTWDPQVRLKIFSTNKTSSQVVKKKQYRTNINSSTNVFINYLKLRLEWIRYDSFPLAQKLLTCSNMFLPIGKVEELGSEKEFSRFVLWWC